MKPFRQNKHDRLLTPGASAKEIAADFAAAPFDKAMRAKYLINASGEWKGIALTPFCEFDVPEHLQEVVARNPNFEVLADEVADEVAEPAPVKRGRPRKVQDADAA